MTALSGTPAADADYRPFPNEAGRNQRQETLEVPALVRALNVPAGARILEVGCGRGIALPALARLCRPERLVGLDIDPALLTEAEPRAFGLPAELVCGDVRALPFADGDFDVIIDFGTLYHVSRAAQGLAEIARVLAPGGVFIEETVLSQLLSHPRRSFGRAVPWESAPALQLERWAGLWQSRRNRPPGVASLAPPGPPNPPTWRHGGRLRALTGMGYRSMRDAPGP